MESISVGFTDNLSNLDSVFFSENPQSTRILDSPVDKRTEFPLLPLPR